MQNLKNNKFIPPQRKLSDYLLNYIINCHWLKRLCRNFMRLMPFIHLESDVKNVVYLNWVIPEHLAKQFVPPDVEIFSKNNQTILTILSYQHGGFSPKLLGRLRKFFPSPKQSNWRFYIKTIYAEIPIQPHVLFIKNIFDSAMYTLGTRLCSDALPSHLTETFIHHCTNHDIYSQLKAGAGSTPEYRFQGHLSTYKTLPPDFMPFYSNWDEAITQITQQDVAITAIEDLKELSQANIQLDFDPATIRMIDVDVYQAGTLLHLLEATHPPFAFLIPKLKFSVLSEQILHPKHHSNSNAR